MKRLITIALCLVLAACSGKPSSGDIREMVTQQLIDDNNKDWIEISDFEKTNGFEKDPNTYVVDIKYKVVFKKSLEEIAKEAQQEAGNAKPDTGSAMVDRELSSLGGALAGIGVLALQFQHGNFKAGDSYEKTDQVTLIKTDNGWQLGSRPQSAL